MFGYVKYIDVESIRFLSKIFYAISQYTLPKNGQSKPKNMLEYTVSFYHLWGILKLLQAKKSRSTENISRLRGFKIAKGHIHQVLFKIEKSPFNFLLLLHIALNKKKKCRKKKKKNFGPCRDLNSRPLDQSDSLNFCLRSAYFN